MFKQFAIAMLAMASMTTAKKLWCDSEDGTCMQVTRDTADGQCIPIFNGEHVHMQLGVDEIWGVRRERRRRRCYWRLQVPCTDNAEELVPLEGDSHDFGDYVVSTIGRHTMSKFEIAIKEDAAEAHYALSFINSCDVRPEYDEEDSNDVSDEDENMNEDEDMDEDEDEDGYDDPICKEINIMVMKQQDDDEMDQ